MPKRQLNIGGAVLCGVVLLGGGASFGAGGGAGRAKKQTPQAAPQKARYGPFSVENYDQIRALSSKTGIEATVTGNKVRARSTLYDADAQKITFSLTRFGVPARQKLTNSVASGGVRIVVRNPEVGRKTIVTCDRAVYKASTNPNDRGRIDLSGNIRSEVFDPSAEGPAIVTAKTGYINLIDAETTEIVLNQGDANVILKEPPPQSRPRDTPKPAAPRKKP